jgi:hypothetical protein
MQPLLDVAAELIEAAQKSDNKGLYFYAGMKYAQVWTTLTNIIILRDAGTVALTAQEERRLATMLPAKVRNGKQLSGRTKDSPAEAIDALLEEVLRGF